MRINIVLYNKDAAKGLLKRTQIHFLESGEPVSVSNGIIWLHHIYIKIHKNHISCNILNESFNWKSLLYEYIRSVFKGEALFITQGNRLSEMYFSNIDKDTSFNLYLDNVDN